LQVVVAAVEALEPLITSTTVLLTRLEAVAAQGVIAQGVLQDL